MDVIELLHGMLEQPTVDEVTLLLNDWHRERTGSTGVQHVRGGSNIIRAMPGSKPAEVVKRHRALLRARTSPSRWQMPKKLKARLSEEIPQELITNMCEVVENNRIDSLLVHRVYTRPEDKDLVDALGKIDSDLLPFIVTCIKDENWVQLAAAFAVDVDGLDGRGWFNVFKDLLGEDGWVADLWAGSIRFGLLLDAHRWLTHGVSPSSSLSLTTNGKLTKLERQRYMERVEWVKSVVPAHLWVGQGTKTSLFDGDDFSVALDLATKKLRELKDYLDLLGFILQDISKWAESAVWSAKQDVGLDTHEFTLQVVAELLGCKDSMSNQVANKVRSQQSRRNDAPPPVGGSSPSRTEKDESTEVGDPTRASDESRESRRRREQEAREQKMAEEGAMMFGKPPKNTVERADTNWGEMWVIKFQMDRTLPARLLSPTPIFSERGQLPRAMHRFAIDKQIFTTKVRAAGGSVLIDCSGSMHLTNDEIHEIINLIPAGIVALYSGSSDKGWLRIVAQNGRCVERHVDLRQGPIWESYDDSAIASYGGGNIIDGPALEWLAKQDPTRIWVSDGLVTGLADCRTSANEQHVNQLCRRNRIIRVENNTEALEALRKVKA